MEDEITGRQFKCLDNGFVRLVDHMATTRQLSRRQGFPTGKGTKDRQRGSLAYTPPERHKHTSPFEMVEFKFHVKLPIFFARQWIHTARQTLTNTAAAIPK
jgi:thymidylate synthase (FAD)